MRVERSKTRTVKEWNEEGVKGGPVKEKVRRFVSAVIAYNRNRHGEREHRQRAATGTGLPTEREEFLTKD